MSTYAVSGRAATALRSHTTRIGALLASLLVTLAVGAGSPALPAAHAAGCSENNRDHARAIAASGRFYGWIVRWNVGRVVGVHPGYARYINIPTSVELRYDPISRCAWGVASGAFNHVYLDRSDNGGRTWVGWLGPRAKSSAVEFTGVFNDAAPYVMRACATSTVGMPGKTIVRCTRWH